MTSIPLLFSVSDASGARALSLVSLLEPTARGMRVTDSEVRAPAMGWRAVPARWSAEKEPFCILVNREQCLIHVAVARANDDLTSWPTLHRIALDSYSEKPPLALCKLVPLMWSAGPGAHPELFVLAIKRDLNLTRLMRITNPKEDWTEVRELGAEDRLRNAPQAKVKVMYHYSEQGGGGVQQGTFLVLLDGELSPTVSVKAIDRADAPFRTVCASAVEGAVGWGTRFTVLYVRSPPWLQAESRGIPLSVFVVGLDKVSGVMTLYHVPDPCRPWTVVQTLPLPPGSRVSPVYPRSMCEPLLLVTTPSSGMISVMRLYIHDHIKTNKVTAMMRAQGQQLTIPPPPLARVVHQMPMPVLLRSADGQPTAPSAVRIKDLTMEMALDDLSLRPFTVDHIGTALEFETTPNPPPVVVQQQVKAPPPPPIAPSAAAALTAGVPLPPQGPVAVPGLDISPDNHAPLPLLMCRQRRAQLEVGVGALKAPHLEWVGGEHPAPSEWKVTPLRWAPRKEVVYCVLQHTSEDRVRVGVLDIRSERVGGPGQWDCLVEFQDPFLRRAELFPFMYQQSNSNTASIFVFALTPERGALYYVANAKSSWALVREVDPSAEGELLGPQPRVKVMYHRPRDPATSTSLQTLLLVHTPTHVSVRLVVDPSAPTVEVQKITAITPDCNVKVLYAFDQSLAARKVWPMEVFCCWTSNKAKNLRLAHVHSPEQAWTLLYEQVRAPMYS